MTLPYDGGRPAANIVVYVAHSLYLVEFPQNISPHLVVRQIFHRIYVTL